MNQKERLMSLIYEAGDLAQKGSTSDFTSTLAEYLLANGVILPPVKVGDKVWYHDYAPTSKGLVRIVRSSDVDRITIGLYASFLTLNNGFSIDLDNFGKTVFLTQKEAEQVAKECEDT